MSCQLCCLHVGPKHCKNVEQNTRTPATQRFLLIPLCYVSDLHRIRARQIKGQPNRECVSVNQYKSSNCIK